MFWACFSWGHKGPCYVWPPEKKALKEKYGRIIDRYNRAHEAKDKEKWIASEYVRRSKLKRPPKKMREWKYTAKTGAMERGNKKGGIDWIRYQYEILRPRFLPFMKKLGPDFIAQEDNAPSHASHWNRKFWKESNVQLMYWPPNSPDLSAIEPPWKYLKWKQGIIWSRKKLLHIWKENWKHMPQEKLQRFVERIQGNIEWVIRLKGGNEYREGTKPPPLDVGEREQLDQEIKDFLAVEDPVEDTEDPWEDIMNEVELLTLDDGEEFDPMVSSDDGDE